MTPLADPTQARARKVRPQYRDGGKRWPSVTTVLKVLDAPALDRWRVRMALTGVDPYADYSAADTGTLCHEAVAWALGGAPYPQFEQHPAEVVDSASRAFRSFRAWQAAHDVVPVLVEHEMASARLGYGGTLDCFAIVDGRPEVLDFKTSAAVYPEYFVQTAAYARLLADTSEHRAVTLRIVRLDKGDNEDFDDPTVEAVMDFNGEPDLAVSPEHFALFEAALSAYRLKAKIGDRPIKAAA